MGYILLIQVPGRPEQKQPISQDSFVIGSLPSNHIYLSSESVEPIHALLEKDDRENISITDLGSVSGIKVNGSKIDVEKQLSLNYVIQIGDCLLKLQQGDKTDVPLPSRVSLPRSRRIPRVDERVDQETDEVEQGIKERLFFSKSSVTNGPLLEAVAYWGHSVLDIEHFHPSLKDFDQLTIGATGKAHLFGFASEISDEATLVNFSGKGFVLSLTRSMKARVRMDGKVYMFQGPKEIKIGRRDIAHIECGPIKYFLLFIKKPKLELPNIRSGDSLFMTMFSITFLFYFAFMSYIGITAKKTEDKSLDKEDIWTIVDIPKKKIKKKPRRVIIAKIKQKTPIPPKIEKPKKLVPQKPIVKKKPQQPTKKIYRKSKQTTSLSTRKRRGSGGGGVGKGAPSGKGSGGGKGRAGNKRAASPGINLSKLGKGVGLILSKTGAGAITTDFVSSSGGGAARGDMGKSIKKYGLNAVGRAKTVTLAKAGRSASKGFGTGGGSVLGKGKNLGSAFGGKRSSAKIEIPPSDPVVSGGLSAAEVRAVINRNLGQIRQCYERLLQHSPDVSGEIITHFVIGTAGRVTRARIKESSFRNAAIKSCVSKRVKRWKFPKPRGKQPVEVNYPFTFIHS